MPWTSSLAKHLVFAQNEKLITSDEYERIRDLLDPQHRQTLPTAYGNCICACHRRAGMMHITACCSPATDNAVLVERLGAAIGQAFDYYTARNGRRMSIEGDDGEKCWILPFDAFEELKHALAALRAPSTETHNGND